MSNNSTDFFRQNIFLHIHQSRLMTYYDTEQRFNFKFGFTNYLTATSGDWRLQWQTDQTRTVTVKKQSALM